MVLLHETETKTRKMRNKKMNIVEEEEELLAKKNPAVDTPVRSIKRRKRISKRTGKEFETVTVWTDAGPFINYSRVWNGCGLTNLNEGDMLHIEYSENLGADGVKYRNYLKITKVEPRRPQQKMVQQDLFEEEELLPF